MGQMNLGEDASLLWHACFVEMKGLVLFILCLQGNPNQLLLDSVLKLEAVVVMAIMAVQRGP